MIRAGQGIVLIAVALLSVGVVMVNSAGQSIAPERAVALADVLGGRAAIFALLAVIAMVVGASVPTERPSRARGIRNPVPWILAISVLLLLLVHVPGLGRQVNGARRWISLGPIGFQPSELAKWGVLVVLAWHAARRPGAMGRPWRGFGAPMAVVGLLAALIAVEDLGTAVLIVAVAVTVLVAGGAKLGHALALVPVGILGFVAAVLQSPYRLERLKTFLDPFGDPQGSGYHMIQSMAAVSGGGLAGRGLGNSIQKFGYLPEDTTDFIFAIICEELGLVGAALVILLYAALGLCGLAILRRVVHPFARLLGLGILLTIELQALINLAVVTGCGPTKGIALPLVSAGGTGWVLTGFCIGLLAGMDGTAVSGQPSAVSGRGAGTSYDPVDSSGCVAEH